MAGEVKISTLRVSAEMDASKYVAGMQQMEAADKAKIASGQNVSVSVTDTQVKISQAGDVLARLNRQFVDGYAAQQRFGQALTQLSNGIERGKISIQEAENILGSMSQKLGVMADSSQFASRGQVEFAGAIDRTNAKLREQIFWREEWLREFNKQPVIQRGASNQNTLGAFGAFNTGQQLQDIAVTAAMGQSIPTIALQQGLQLGTALEIQLQNAKKEGLSMAQALSSSFFGILSPVNLLAIGLTGVAAAAIQYFTSGTEKARSYQEVLQEELKLVDDLAKRYGIVADARDKAMLQRTSGALQRTLSSDQSDALESLRGTRIEAIDALTRFVPAEHGGQYIAENKYKAFEAPILRLVHELQVGQVDVHAFDTAIDDVVRKDRGQNKAAEEIEGIVKAAIEAYQQLGLVVQVLDKLRMHRDVRVPEAGDLGALSQFDLQDKAAQDRLRKQFDADMLGIGARSPQELEAAARAREAAANPQGSAGEQATRIELAGKRALKQAEQQLKDAQDERQRSLDRTLDSAKLDVELVGKTKAEVDGLRMAAQLEADVREQAARNHVKADEAEIARLREKAIEYGKLQALQEAQSTIHQQGIDLEQMKLETSLVGANTLAHDRAMNALKAEQQIRELGIPLYGKEAEAIRANTAAIADQAEAYAKAKLAADLQFERRQIGRDDEDQAIASQLHSIGLPDDLNSTEASLIRTNLRLAEAKDDFKGFFHDVLSGFRDGKSAVEAFTNALSNLAGKLADRFLDRAMDELFGALTGTGGQSSTGGTGLGLIGKLLGLGSGFSSAAPFQANTTLGAVLGLGGGPFNADTAAKLLGGLGSPLGGGSGSNALIGSDGNISRYAAAIRFNESGSYGGNYSALGPITGSGDRAYGAYQVMGSNVPSWTQRWYGDRLSPSQFLHNPAAQDSVFKGEFGSYVDRWGPNRAANAWFTGSPTGGGRDVLGTSNTQYVEKFQKALEGAPASISKLSVGADSAAQSLVTASQGASHFGSLLSSFMGGGGASSGWFQGLSSLFGGASGAVNYMMGISPGATGAILAGGALGPAGLYHEGGIAGYPGSSRFVSPSVFMGARRYHMGGLAGDEVPAILRRGEPVFRNMDHARQVVGANQNIPQLAAQVAKLINVNLKNINVYDPSVVGDYQRTDEGEQATMNVLRRTGNGRGL